MSICKADSAPSITPTAQAFPGIFRGSVVEALFCIAAGSGALTITDTSDGAQNAAERVFRIAAPAAMTRYLLPSPITVENCLTAAQATLGTWVAVHRPPDGGDIPSHRSSRVRPVAAAAVVFAAPTYIEAIEVVAPGSAGSLTVRVTQDNDFAQLFSVAYTALSAGQIIKFGDGPVKFPAMNISALPTGCELLVHYYPSV